MYLSDEQIRFALAHNQLTIDPLNFNSIQPVSIDLTLGDTFITPWEGVMYEIDDPDTWRGKADVTTLSQWVLPPDRFVLCTTQERVHFRSRVRGEHKERHDLWGQVHGKSTLGRLGLLIHITAGIIDPGFDGKITLEVKNVGPNAIVLHPGTPICQLTIAQCGIVERPYPRTTSKYNGQDKATWAK